MNKSTEAFRTIGEVADELEVPKHVLRFWEGKFPQIRPMKRGGGRRYYRPEDMELLRGIRSLLHKEGYTIKGVQKILREQGIDHVKTYGRVAGTGTRSGDGRRVSRSQKDTAAVGITIGKTKAAAAARDGVDRVQRPPVARPERSPDSDVIRSVIRELEHCRALLAPLRERPMAAESRQKRAGGRT